MLMPGDAKVPPGVINHTFIALMKTLGLRLVGETSMGLCSTSMNHAKSKKYIEKEKSSWCHSLI
jgi:hypothetical protein